MAGEWESTIGALLDETGGSIKTGPFGTKLKASEYTATGVPVISVGEVGFGRLRVHHDTPRVDETVTSRMPEYLLKAGDIVFGRKGAVERSAQVQLDEDGCFLGSDGIRIRLNDKECDPKFISYQLQTTAHRNWMIQHAAGTTMPSLNEGIIRRIPIVLKPLSEQKAIASVLGALDDKIELNRRMNATLEAMARALFQSWFVDFDPVRAKLDGGQPVGLDPATASLFPEHLEDSLLGKKPVDWEVTTLDHTLAVLETGGRPKGGVAGITSGVPSIGAESIVSIGVFDFGKTKFVPVEFYEGMKKGHIESHDVLLYKDGGRPGEFEPHVSMFGDGFPFEDCSINEHVYRLRSNQRLSQEYLYFWLNSEFVLAEMRIKGTGVAIPGLNSTAVRSLAVLVPPPTIVEAFTKKAAPLVSRILSNAKQSHTLATLRDTLLPKLLSGELHYNQ
ncbi:MAG: restriction endonuclease subunit S [Cyanobium sp. D14.bin.5]|nr:restriction endonuclease subunit S [Cyanobium sp. D14.bin.5]